MKKPKSLASKMLTDDNTDPGEILLAHIVQIDKYIDFLEKEQTKSNDMVFLSTLVRYAKQYGWNGDYTEVVSFVDWCHDELGVERREMELGERQCS